MAVHFIHVSKAGGTALRYAIRSARVQAGGKLVSPWGEVWGHDHRFRFADLRSGHKAIFPLRDPASRFLSGYYSRLREGAPRYFIEWSAKEAQAFEWFPTPQALAEALAEPSGEARRRAEFAMGAIAHVRQPMTHWTGKPSYLRRRLDNVLYVAMQETLAEDWEKLKDLLDIPRDQMLPTDDVRAHRTAYAADDDRTLSDKALQALREWYADDYELIEIAADVRAGRVERRPPALARLVPAVFRRR
jgi:hypothetical protein